MNVSGSWRVIHHATRARRWKCYVQAGSEGVSYGAYSRLASVKGTGGWIPEVFETAPAPLIAEARRVGQALMPREVACG